MIGNEGLTLTANSLTNNQGKKIISNKNTILILDKYLQNSGLISAGQVLDIIAKGTKDNISGVVNSGEIVGGIGDQAIDSTYKNNKIDTGSYDLSNQDGGKIRTTKTDNGSGSLQLIGKNLHNSGQISSASDITARFSDNINNNKNSSIISLGNLSLLSNKNFKNDHANIYSFANLYLGNTSFNKDQLGKFDANNDYVNGKVYRNTSFENISGTVEAKGDIVIHSDKVTNRRNQLLASQVTYGTKEYKLYRYGPRSYVGGPSFVDISTFLTHKFATGNISTSDPIAKINAEGNLIISAQDDVTNDHSEIHSGANMFMEGKNLNNNSVDLGGTYTFTSACHTTIRTCGIYNLHPEYGIIYDPSIYYEYGKHYLPSEFGGPRSIPKGDYTETVKIGKDSDTTYSTIKVGKKLSGTFRGNLNNKDIAENQGKISTKGSDVNTVGNSGDTNDIKNSGTLDMSNNINIPTGDNGLFKLTNNPNSTSNGKGSSNADDDAQVKSEVNSGDISTGNNEDIKATNRPKYLITTNTNLIDQNEFIGSEYFLSRMGYDIDEDVLLIGDPFYETRFVASNIQSRLNDKYINDQIGSDTEQMTYLYDNAILASEDLDLQVGIKLSKEQINNLKNDIIWLVAKEINGNKVLVPEIYLAKITRDNLDMDTGSIIKAAGDVILTAKNDIGNDGVIRSGGNLNIASSEGSVNNQINSIIKSSLDLSLTAKDSITNNEGEIRSGGNLNIASSTGSINNNSTIISSSNLSLNASQDIINEGGKIAANDALNMTAGRNIENKALLERKNFRGGNFRDELKSRGEVSGKNVALIAGKDIINEGSKLSSVEQASLEAGNNVDIKTSALESRSRRGIHRGYELNHDIVNQSSDISTGGLMTIKSANDSFVRGSNINSGGGIAITTGGDFKEESVSDYSHYEKQWSKKRKWRGSKTYRREVTTITQKGSNVIATNGNVSVNSASDVAITGSKIGSTSGDLNIVAKDKVSIASAVDYKRNYSKTTKKGFMSSSVNISESKNWDQVKASASSGTNLGLLSGGDTNIIASDLTAGGNVNITAGKSIDGSGVETINNDAKLNILSATDDSYSRQVSKKQKFKLEVAKDGLDYLTINKESELDVVKSNVASNIVGASIDISGGADVLLKGSDVRANTGDVKLASRAGSVTIDAGKAYEEHTKKSSETKLGFHVSKDLTIETGSFLNEKSNNGKISNVGSNIVSNNGKVIISAQQDSNIVASNVSGKSGIETNAGGDVNIVGGVDTAWSSKSKKEGKQRLKFETTSSELSAKAGIRYEREKSSSSKTSIASSNVQATAGDVKLVSDNDILVGASNVVASNDVSLEAKENVNIISKQQILENKNSKFMIDAGIRAGIDHNLGNMADSLEGLGDVKLGGAVEDSIKLVDAIIGADDMDEALSGNEDAINSTMRVIEAYQTAKQGPSASAAISVNVEVAGSKHKDRTEQSLGSAVVAGRDVKVKATNSDIKIEGSRVEGGRNVVIDAGDEVKIIAAKDESSSKDSSYNLEVDVDIIGTSGPGATDINGAISSSKSTSLTYNNSIVKAGEKLDLDAKGDVEIAGGNVSAKEVEMDVEGNLNVASQQNSSSSKNNSLNFGLGVSAGGVNASLGFQKGKSKRSWVDNQTSIIGEDKVAINVSKNTDITGALIGNIKDGEDGGNLAINTGSLTYKDLQDVDKSRNYGMNISGGAEGKSKAPQMGGFGFNYSMHDKRQDSNATIGEGTVNIADNSDISGLNRDINKAQVITKDIKVDPITGQVKVLTKEDREKSLKDAGKEWLRADKVITGSVKQVAREVGAKQVVSGVNKLELGIDKGVDSAASVGYGLVGYKGVSITGKEEGTVSIKENIENFTANRKAISSLQEERPDLVDILNNKTDGYSTTQVEEAKRELANRVTKYNGIADADVRLVLDNEVRVRKEGDKVIMEQTAGFREKGTNNININLLSDHNMSASGGVETLGHELSHYKGNSREDYADLDGGHLAGSLFGNNLSSGNVYDKNLVNAREYISGQKITPELIENSKIANAVPEGNRENSMQIMWAYDESLRAAYPDIAQSMDKSGELGAKILVNGSMLATGGGAVVHTTKALSKEGIKIAVKKFGKDAVRNIGVNTVNGVVSSSAAALVSGADIKTGLVSVGAGTLVNVVTGGLADKFKPEGKSKQFGIAVGANALGAMSSSYLTTKLTNPNATSEDYISNISKSLIVSTPGNLLVNGMRVRAGIVGGGSVNFGMGMLNAATDTATTGAYRGYDQYQKKKSTMEK